MAGGKETPRQKMIGLMYLVLTAMLALNVSKQILEGYLSVNESLDKSKRNIAENNVRVTKAFEASIASSPEAEPYFKQSQIAQKSLHEIYDYLNKVKGNLIHYTLKMPPGIDVLGDTINLRQKAVKDKIDNYDMPTALLLGASEHNLKTGDYTASDLRDKLTAVHDKLLSQLEMMQKTKGLNLLKEDYDNLKKKIAVLKPTDSGREEDGVKFTWPLDNFFHLPMAAVFVNLQKMQVDVKNVEAEILQVFSAATGKLAIKPTRLIAQVIAPSKYISAGQKYTADIFLSASFSKLAAGDMEVMLGVDSATAAKGGKGNAIPIIDGVGKYEVGTSSPGDVKYQGVVKFKKPDGTYEIYPFEQDYKVAPSAVAVSADYMNVFYRGVVNPVSAGVAGRSPQDIVISATGAGAKYVQKGPGKYDFTFTGTGDCFITVSAKEPGGGVKPQGPPIKFKVKPLPKPDAKIGGKFAPPEMKVSELATVGAIGAGANGFEFAANYIVQSYEITGKVKGAVRLASGNGSNLDQNALNLIRNIDVGSKFFIELKIKGPDGLPYTSLCSIKVIR
jgi:gliding motility-associated protein GldM